MKSRWLDVIIRLASSDIGLAIAYESHDGLVISNPSSGTEVEARALFVIIREGCLTSPTKVAEVLTRAG